MNKKAQSDFFVFLIVGVAILSVILATFLLTSGIVYSLNSYRVIVTQNENIIYKGVKACVEVSSGGDTTTILISQGFLCLFPKEIIVGKNIGVRNE
jgi:hypothetical protein